MERKIESFEVGLLNDRRSSGFGSPRAWNRIRDMRLRRRRLQSRSQCWIVGTQQNDLASRNWSDRISSIRVFGRTTLRCRDHGFYGEELTINQDVPCLPSVQLRN
jgi:hypothetical protein